jgi:hypothetical protein
MIINEQKPDWLKKNIYPIDLKDLMVISTKVIHVFTICGYSDNTLSCCELLKLNDSILSNCFNYLNEIPEIYIVPIFVWVYFAVRFVSRFPLLRLQIDICARFTL